MNNQFKTGYQEAREEASYLILYFNTLTSNQSKTPAYYLQLIRDLCAALIATFYRTNKKGEQVINWVGILFQLAKHIGKAFGWASIIFETIEQALRFIGYHEEEPYPQQQILNNAVRNETE